MSTTEELARVRARSQTAAGRAATVVLVLATLVTLGHVVHSGWLAHLGLSWAPMQLGSALLVIGAAISVGALAAGREPDARRTAWVTLVTSATLFTLYLVVEVADGVPSLELDPGSWWLPSTQLEVAVALLMVGVLLRRGRVVSRIRAVALVLVVSVSAANLTSIAHGGEGLALAEVVTPMRGLAAASVLVLATALVAATPHRWPLDRLLRSSGDAALLTRLLPIVLAVPVLPSAMVAIARALGVQGGWLPVVGSLGPVALLVAVLVVSLQEHRRLYAEVARQQDLLTRTIDALPQAVFLRDADAALLHANPAARELIHQLGLELDEVTQLGPAFAARVEVADEHGDRLAADALPALVALRERRPHEQLLALTGRDDDRRWLMARAVPTTLPDASTGVVVSYGDLTAHEEARRALAVSERSLRLTLANAPIGGALVTPDGVFEDVNASLCRMLGRSREELVGSGFAAITHPDDLDADLTLVTACLAGERDRYRLEKRYLHADGHVLLTELSVSLLRDDNSTPLRFIAQIEDITERRAMEEQLRLAAVRDRLTGLANRRGLEDRFASERARSLRAGGDLGVLLLDLDGFKGVNDTYGHGAGDRVLCEVARRLEAVCREVDTVARLGGDEFVVLCSPAGGLEGLRSLRRRVVEAVETPIALEHAAVRVGASVGLALGHPGDEAEDLLLRADAEMYREKRARVAGA